MKLKIGDFVKAISIGPGQSEIYKIVDIKSTILPLHPLGWNEEFTVSMLNMRNVK